LKVRRVGNSVFLIDEGCASTLESIEHSRAYSRRFVNWTAVL